LGQIKISDDSFWLARIGFLDLAIRLIDAFGKPA